MALSLAERLGSRIRLVRAVEHQPYDIETTGSLATNAMDSLDSPEQHYLNEAKQAIEASVPVETAVLTGPTTEALMTDLHEHRPDLLVMSSHGRTGFIRWALGSVTDRMLRGPVPILVLRPRAETKNHGLV